jgi:hypothetical protein
VSWGGVSRGSGSGGGGIIVVGGEAKVVEAPGDAVIKRRGRGAVARAVPWRTRCTA